MFLNSFSETYDLELKYIERFLPYCRYARSAEIKDVIAIYNELSKKWGRDGKVSAIIIRSALYGLSEKQQSNSELFPGAQHCICWHSSSELSDCAEKRSQAERIDRK